MTSKIVTNNSRCNHFYDSDYDGRDALTGLTPRAKFLLRRDGIFNFYMLKEAIKKDQFLINIKGLGLLTWYGIEDWINRKAVLEDDKNKRILMLLEESLSRIKSPSLNANGGAIQMGGIFWRLLDAVEIVDEVIHKYESKSTIELIRKNHPRFQRKSK